MKLYPFNNRLILALIGCIVFIVADRPLAQEPPAPGGANGESDYDQNIREGLRRMRPFIDQPAGSPIADGQLPTPGGDADRPNDGRPVQDDLLSLPPRNAEDKAVRDALDWLTQQQNAEGYWLETKSRIGHTGMAVLAYLAYGARHDERGPYQEPLE